MASDGAIAVEGASWSAVDLFNPSSEHALLRETIREFVRDEVEPQALEHDRTERFNLQLFRKTGALDLLGLTVPAEDGGAGMDAVAAREVTRIPTHIVAIQNPPAVPCTPPTSTPDIIAQLARFGNGDVSRVLRSLGERRTAPS